LQVQLFAHFVWNGAVLAADLIDRGKFPVAGHTVLELGAGAGLPGIISTLQGAEIVVLSDYESPKVLQNLRRNIEENIPKTQLSRIKVEGHIWGQNSDSITRYRLARSSVS
jgi:EEF1A N-terminal glycine/lysine methyltransferase